MCLGSRRPALLVALASVVVSACGAGHPAPLARPATVTPTFSPPSPNQAVPVAPTGPDAVGQPAGARVRGTVATPDRRQLINGAVIMTPSPDEAPVAAVDARIFPDGSFVFTNVAPGTYQIRAQAHTEPDGPPLFAVFRISVQATDLDHVDLTLVPGASVSGKVSLDSVSGRPPPFAGMRVRAPFADGSSFGEALTGDVIRDGSFAIRGVMTGSHILVVEGLQQPWVLKSVMHRGQDITDVGLQADSRQRVEDVRITLTDTASDVSGIVRDKDGHGVAGALVAFVPVPHQFWAPASRRFGRLRTDAAGRYRVRGLPPGDYRAAASLELDERDTYRAGILRTVAQTGVELRLDALTTRTLDLPLTRMVPPGRASVR